MSWKILYPVEIDSTKCEHKEPGVHCGHTENNSMFCTEKNCPLKVKK